MLEQLRQLFTPQIEAQALQAALSRLRQGLPPPVIWLFGKVQSGKTAIIRALTGAERAQIGSGFAPCTRWAARYDFPNADFPLAVFLDTRGLGEAGYDPREDVAAFQAQAHMLLESLSGPWIWPLSNSWTLSKLSSRQNHPGQSSWHKRPYITATRQTSTSMCTLTPSRRGPGRATVPAQVRRALDFQRTFFADMPITRFVPLDFTLPEDGFHDPFYGREALLDALAEAHPHAVYQTLHQLPALTRELKSLHFHHAQPHIMAYACAAGAVGAAPLPMADLPIISALQLKMLHTIAAIYRQPLRLKTFLELGEYGWIGGALAPGYTQSAQSHTWVWLCHVRSLRRGSDLCARLCPLLLLSDHLRRPPATPRATASVLP